MKKIKSLLAAGLFVISSAAFAQPANDDCSAATVLTLGTECIPDDLTGVGSTTELPSASHDPSCGAFQGGDVWFKFTVPSSGTFRIDISGSGMRWVLLDGVCGSFTEIRCTDGAKNFDLQGLIGQDLYIQVFRFNSSSSNPFTICVWEIETPENDNCADATDLTVGEECSPQDFSCELSTGEDAANSFDPSCGAYRGGDVWFKFQAPPSGNFRVEISGGGIYWTLLDGACGAFTQLFCDNRNENFEDPALANSELYIQVYRFNSEQGNPFTICITEIESPTNDNCQNPQSLTVGTECNYQSFSNELSTEQDAADSFDPSCGAYRGGDVWFTFTVPASGNFRIDVNGGGIQWSLLQGNCGAFTELRCTDNARNFSDPSLAGQTLYLQVFRFNSDQGNPFDICIWEIDPPSNDNCANPINIPVGEECTVESYSNEFSTAEDVANSFDPSCGAYRGGDVWFTFTVPSSGNFRIDVDGGGIQWALLQGSCGDFTQLRCTDNARNFSDPELAGETLYLQIYRFNSDQGNPFDICIWEIEPPSNNNCANPIFLAVGDSCESFTFSSEFATAEDISVADDPSCGAYRGGDVWFRFLAPDNGSFTIEKTNTGAYMSILTGSCGNFTEQLCENDVLIDVNEPALGGQLITLRLHRFNSDQGNEFDICISADDIAPNDNCADAIPLVAGQSCDFELFHNRNATQENGLVTGPGCGNYQSNDIWFTTEVPPSGRLRIDFSYLGTGPFATALYSGTCGDFSQIGCFPNPNEVIVELAEFIGETIYLRVYRSGSAIGTNVGICLAEVDCNGDDGGTAFIDNCETCVGGNTGLEECVPDCNGDFGGVAFIDNCGDCVGGNTGLEECLPDCNGDFEGTAFFDNCGICVGGNTGLEACLPDCNGDFGGSAFTDLCDQCVGGNTNLEPCCPDPFPAIDEESLSVSLSDNNATLSWEAILGQNGCQVQGREAGTTELLVDEILIGGNVNSFSVSTNPLVPGTTYQWRVRCGCSIDPPIGGPFTPWQNVTLPGEGVNLQTAPNPVTNWSTVTFSILYDSYVTLEVYDLSGKVLSTIFAGNQFKGIENRYEFDASDLPNGIYLYRLTTEKEIITEKFMIGR